MILDERIQKRFDELDRSSNEISMKFVQGYGNIVDAIGWQKWSTSVLNLLQNAFGTESTHFKNFRRIYDACKYREGEFRSALGVFRAAKEDYEGGYIFSLEKAVSGEVFGDFVLLAKQSLNEGHKDVAAVLACAALEDALKRYARTEGLDVDEKDMQQVINALKGKSLVSGAQKTLLDAMPKIRDYAMHANWDKVTPESVRSVVGFVEEFLIQRF